MVILLILIVIPYALINFYAGKKLKKVFSFINSERKNAVFWIIFILFASIYIFSRLLKDILSQSIQNKIQLIGYYWLAFLMYFIMFTIIIDILQFIINKIRKSRNVNLKETGNSYFYILAVFLAIILILYGSIHAQSTKVNHYSVNINKNAGNIKKLNVVMVSDIHIGAIINKQRVDKMVTEINKLNPDIIFIAGDTVDSEYQPLVDYDCKSSFLKLKSKYGTYIIPGNHEYFGSNPEKTLSYYKASGFNLLTDQYVLVDNSFYVVGRDDASSRKISGEKRAKLSDVMNGINKNLPVIVLDHQPVDLKEPETEGVDLQLSGHTHAGQMFPANLLVKAMYEDYWGYKRVNNFNLIVSSGYGTWGPPMRIGTDCEIVNIKISFKEK